MTNSREPDDKAEVSRILHFVIEHAERGVTCRPCIVLEDYPEMRQPGLVDVTVFPDGPMDGRYGLDSHNHTQNTLDDTMHTGRANYPLTGRFESAVRPNHSCRAVGSWHWPRECKSLQDPIKPYTDSTGVKYHHMHGLGLAGDFCPACKREYEETHARRPNRPA